MVDNDQDRFETEVMNELQQQEKSMKTIATAFVKAQKEFAPALKTSTNPHFRSKYVSLDGCIEAVLDALNNNGIALIQQTHDCESGVKIETILIHESGETLTGGILHVPAPKQDPQGYGSALTYARRYSLMATCGIILKLTEHRRVKSLSIKIVRQIERMVVENRRTCDIAKELDLEYNRVSHWVRKAKKEGVH